MMSVDNSLPILLCICVYLISAFDYNDLTSNSDGSCIYICVVPISCILLLVIYIYMTLPVSSLLVQVDFGCIRIFITGIMPCALCVPHVRSSVYHWHYKSYDYMTSLHMLYVQTVPILCYMPTSFIRHMLIAFVLLLPRIYA